MKQLVNLRVQHRATKLENLKDLSYEERINLLSIQTLEKEEKELILYKCLKKMRDMIK